MEILTVTAIKHYAKIIGTSSQKLASSPKACEDMRYHFQYLANALRYNSKELFSQYSQWAKDLFDGLNIPNLSMSLCLQAMNETLKETEQNSLQALEYIHTAQKLLDNLEKKAELVINPFHDLLQVYTDALLDGNRSKASSLILDAAQRGKKIDDLYLAVFEPFLRHIGYLWQNNRISIAQEHFCTAATQMIMSQLYPFLFQTATTGPTIIGSCISGELHEVGMRMVTDLLEYSGFNTYYLGANMPEKDIISTLQEKQASLLAISATMVFHVPKVEALIRHIKQDDNKIKVMVGGYPFNIDPDLYRKIGADATATNAQTAVTIVSTLLADKATSKDVQ